MKSSIVIIATLAILCLSGGLYFLIAQPFLPGVNTILFFILSFLGFMSVTICLILSRIRKKNRLLCEPKPELSRIRIMYYGDEKWLLDGIEIVHL